MSQARSIETYRKMLPVMKHRLDDELEIQAQVYDDISRQVVIENSRTMMAKNTLAEVEAEILRDLKSDDTKMTKGEIDSSVLVNRRRREAFTVYQNARASHEEWAGLLEAWRQKGYSIKTLAELYSSAYFALNTSIRERDSSLRSGGDRSTTEARAEMRRSYAGARSQVPLIAPEEGEPESTPRSRRRVHE